MKNMEKKNKWHCLLIKLKINLADEYTHTLTRTNNDYTYYGQDNGGHLHLTRIKNCFHFRDIDQCQKVANYFRYCDRCTTSIYIDLKLYLDTKLQLQSES